MNRNAQIDSVKASQLSQLAIAVVCTEKPISLNQNHRSYRMNAQISSPFCRACLLAGLLT